MLLLLPVPVSCVQEQESIEEKGLVAWHDSRVSSLRDEECVRPCPLQVSSPGPEEDLTGRPLALWEGYSTYWAGVEGAQV